MAIGMGGRGDGQQWSDSEAILKINLIYLVDGLEGKGGSPRFLG